MSKIVGVQTQSLTVVSTSGGAVLHMLRADSPLFKGFGEVYFSEVQAGQVRAWKCHTQQTQNFAVPMGLLQVVLYDDREQSPSYGHLQEVWLGRERAGDNEQFATTAKFELAINPKIATPKPSYQLLQIPPLVWYGFKAIAGMALICNVVDMPHDPAEAKRRDLHDPKFPYTWLEG